MFSSAPVSATNWIALSSTYPYDDYLKVRSQPIIYADGFNGIFHPLYRNNRDIAFNKHTLFELTSASSLFDVMEETKYAEADLGVYTYITKDGNYVSTLGKTLYLVPEWFTFYRPAAYFRILNNANGTVSYLQGDGTFMTVGKTSPYRLTMETQLQPVEIYRQQFEMQPNQDSIILIATIPNPVPSLGPATVERFVSTSTTTGLFSALQVNGNFTFNPDSVVFQLSGDSLTYSVDGLNRDQTWVKYYNSLYNTFDSRNVEIENSVSGVEVTRLVNSAYLEDIELGIEYGTLNVNIANGKNIMTAEYEYSFSEEDV